MTTTDTIHGYFRKLTERNGWEASFADAMVFTSFTSPIKRISGKAAYLAATKRFYSMITTVELKDLMVDGQRACAVTHYELQPPGGVAFASDVAEVYGVRDGKITSLDIYFDSAPFPK